MSLNESVSENSPEIIISIIDKIAKHRIDTMLAAIGGIYTTFSASKIDKIDFAQLSPEMNLLKEIIPETDLTVLFEWLGFKIDKNIIVCTKNLSDIQANMDIFFTLSASKRDSILKYEKDGIQLDDEVLKKLLTEGVLQQSLFAEGIVKVVNGRICLQLANGKRLFNDRILQDYSIGSYLRVYKLQNHFMVQVVVN